MLERKNFNHMCFNHIISHEYHTYRLTQYQYARMPHFNILESQQHQRSNTGTAKWNARKSLWHAHMTSAQGTVRSVRTAKSFHHFHIFQLHQKNITPLTCLIID